MCVCNMAPSPSLAGRLSTLLALQRYRPACRCAVAGRLALRLLLPARCRVYQRVFTMLY